MLPGVSGCGPETPNHGEGPSFYQKDSTGVLVSVTYGPVARTPIGWEVDSVPDVVIGAQDSPSDFLYRVQGVKGRSDGGFLVIDGGSRELRFFDPHGSFIRKVGGKGEGPGEFLDPVLVPSPGTDSLLLFDKGLPRFQVFSSDGRNPRTINHTHGWPNGRRPPVGAVGLHSVLFQSREFLGGEIAAFEGEGLRQIVSSFFWYSPSSGERVAVDSTVVDWTYQDRSRVWSVPFRSWPAAAVTESGTFITNGRTPNIFEYDVDGRLHRIFRIDGFERPVTRALIKAKTELEVAERPSLPRAAWERAYAAMPLTEFLPAFSSLRIDATGWLWAEVYGWDPTRPKEWVVIDRNGRARGTVYTPHGLQIEWIGRDFLLGIWTDELGVEYVHRYSLTRDIRAKGGP
jgi:hypothetical protein